MDARNTYTLDRTDLEAPTKGVTQPKWHTVAEVALMLGYGLSKTKQLIATGQIKSIKDGGNRRVLPEWVDEYIAQLAEAA